MNLRKVLLTLMFILFAVLTYGVLETYTLLIKTMEVASITYAQTEGGAFNAVIVWMQFPLLLLIGAILAYLILGDKSLTAQAQNAKPLKK